MKPFVFKPLDGLILLVPTPPSVNGLYATDWATKRRFLSKAGAVWFNAAAFELTPQLPPAAPCVPGRVAVVYEFGRPAKKVRTDLANREKAVSDLLVKCHVIADDSFIDEMTLRWSDALEPGRARLTVRPCR